ncbi:MAG: DUF4258 domain-containing protein [Lachnospiraceae bacterium]|nr:DUF4258 domain-containing protein [Lachnospiraceae bacterium]
MELSIKELRKFCSPENIQITLHAAKRLEQRKISLRDIISCIQNGKIIEQYPEDYPYPSCLIMGQDTQNDTIHTVLGKNGSHLFLITAYHPDLSKWEADYITRKDE